MGFSIILGRPSPAALNCWTSLPSELPTINYERSELLIDGDGKKVRKQNVRCCRTGQSYP